MKIVLSLYDFTGEAVKLWAIAGYKSFWGFECHESKSWSANDLPTTFKGGGSE